ncbi:MAG: signal recognition particle protein [Nitrososphaerota archaeon]|jgi:signal recognition particle subunit SRP54|nr:signal recognition particle receptor subunit alpha [Nitrososphaerota archaeon]MDG6927707.1 signal recognition particle protein [Nitrososphaerota archaeon]MDG6930174.1 signal recognition particle protein [Nitrososphaerota archaeon]MDG6932047.1 signal recognition particle protein [Nitrososphaerota archaeon]MDG6935422.1 signal recognition particle protein [Nitrososphaerota archaeon]
MLDDLKDGLRAALDKFIRRGGIDEQALKEFIVDLQRVLLKSDVNVKLVLEFSKKIEERLKSEGTLPGISLKEMAVKAVYDEMTELLGGDFKLSLGPKNLIMLVGIQGSGKTTFSVKLGKYLAAKGFKVGIIGADIYRPGALEQLQSFASRAGINVYGDPKKDPIKIVKEGLQEFKDRNAIIIDTAGRHKDESSLMQEVKKLEEEVKPTLTLLVVDATIGQQAFNQAKAFSDTVEVGGLVITKLDGSAKGGGALAAAAATGAKVYFISNGERIGDIEEFSPKHFVSRLLGIGDLEMLLDKVKEAEIKVSEKEAKKIMKGRMDFEDFLAQIEQMEKIGPLEKIVDMLPAPFNVNKKEIDKAKVQLKKWKAIIHSMNITERRNPKIINTPRLRRIAAGSGTSEKDVRDLIDALNKGKLMAKAARRMNVPFGASP